MHSSKSCIRCGMVKPITEYYKHPQMGDGHLNKCKACCRSDATKHRGENLEKVRAYDRNRAKDPERAKAAAAVAKRWRNEDRRRAAAHNAVARALRAGAIKALPCERCADEKVVAHHESYNEDQRLVVTWLCQTCHERHKEMVLGIEL